MYELRWLSCGSICQDVLKSGNELQKQDYVDSQIVTTVDLSNEVLYVLLDQRAAKL